MAQETLLTTPPATDPATNPPAAPPAAGAPPATPPAAPPAAGAPPAAPPAAGDWFARLSAEDRAYAQNKGWADGSSGDALFQSYRQLEQLLGNDRAGRTFTIPKDAADADGWNAVYDKLGRPKAASDYQIEFPEGTDPALASSAKEWFHRAGLNPAQAAAVASGYQEAERALVERVQAEHRQGIEALRTEWGAEFDHRVQIARTACGAAGMSQDDVAALESAIGPARAAKVLEFFGRNYVEGEPPGPGAARLKGFGQMTPVSAQQKMDSLRNDPNFMQRYDSNDPKVRAAAIEEMDALARLAVNAKMG